MDNKLKKVVSAIVKDFLKKNKRNPKDDKELALFVQSQGGDKYIKRKTQEVLGGQTQEQELTPEQKQKAAHGAKLNYLKSLKHKCAEDEELYYYKKGGSVGCGCKKKEDGGEVTKAQKGTVVNKFKNRKQDLATKDSIAANKYNDLEVQTQKPGSYKKNKEGKVLWTPDRTKSPYKPKAKIDHMKCGSKMKKEKCGGSVEKESCGSKVVKTFKEKCGAKMKKHKNGGNLNVIPFMLKGTPKGGVKKRVWRFENPRINDNSEFLDVESNPDKYGRFINISRQVTPKYDGTFDNDTSYYAFVHNPYNADVNIEYDSRDPKNTNPEYKSPKQVLKNKFNTWGEYFKYLLSLKK